VWKIAAGLLCAGIVGAEVRTVCVHDRVRLSVYAQNAFAAEATRLLRGEGITIHFRECAGPSVSLVIAAHPPHRYPRALGLANRSGDRVVPELRVYTEPILKILGRQASAAQVGRAIARVAAHELGHYRWQQIHHDDHGLMGATFEPRDLGSEDSASFHPQIKR
jgi:hypothetical protein